MAFESLLPHRCTIRLPGEIVNEDKWGRPILQQAEPETLPCRFVESTTRVRDNTGTDIRKELYLLLPVTLKVDPAMEILDIRDDVGELLTTAKLEVDRINRQTARQKAHHFKVYLKGSE